MRKQFERLVTLSFLLMIMGLFANLAFGSALREDATNASESHIGLSVLEGSIYLGCSLLILLYYRTTLNAARAAWPFLLICVFAILSTAWSADPTITLRRSLVLSSTTLLGTYLGSRYTVVEFQRILLQAFCVMVILSLLLLVVFPSAVLDPYHRDSFRGLTEHKNMFGEYMCEMLLLSATTAAGSQRMYVKVSLILLAAGMVSAAHSGTALFAAVLTLCIAPVFLLLRFRRLQALPLIFGGSILGAYLMLRLLRASNSVLDILGKDQTLTGRSDIWRLVWEAILRRPLLGYGFDAFWGGLHGESFSVVSVVGWQVAHSHNGYLELLLGFGVVGSIIVLLALARFAKDSLLYVRSQRGLPGLWPISLLLFCLVHAVGEAGLVKRDGFSYLLLVVTSTSLSIRKLRQREDAAPEFHTHSYESDFAGTTITANA